MDNPLTTFGRGHKRDPILKNMPFLRLPDFGRVFRSFFKPNRCPKEGPKGAPFFQKSMKKATSEIIMKMVESGDVFQPFFETLYMPKLVVNLIQNQHFQENAWFVLGYQFEKKWLHFLHNFGTK